MRRVTAWITATATVLALLASYQANAAGVTGKSGDDKGNNTAEHTGKPGENK